ncbi:hypothetical protein [Phaeobacter sp. C3_T13_0]|uniref:hypothetical protein n=1 Tax=Phaeobacter cretensis TaxID=3342641 RepID=UPI0039BCB83F
MHNAHCLASTDQAAASPSDLISDGNLRDLASLDPNTSLATVSDEELAAMARHLLPDIAGELLAHRHMAAQGYSNRPPALIAQGAIA